MAFEAVTYTTAASWGALIQGMFQVGALLQKRTVDLMFRSLCLDSPTPRPMTKMSFEVLQESAEVGKLLMPGRANRLAWQEFQNKLQAFTLFEHAGVAVCLPSEVEVPLSTLVERAAELGPYRDVWTMEGLGWLHAETSWESTGAPEHLLTAEPISALPPRSLIPLHTGLGLSLAERLLATLKPDSPDAELDGVLRRFITLCQRNSREGYVGAALEALGLVTRLRCPEMVRIFDRRLSAIDPDLVGYFWHGVGRGLYFLPVNAIPCSASTWCAIEMAQGEAPHLLGRLNALGGLAWALTLVNIRHPAILETLLQRYGDVIATTDAFSTGVSASLMIWYDIAGDDPYLSALLHHQPDPSDLRLVQLWNSQITAPSQEALQRYYGVLKTRHGLGEVFRHQPLSALVNRLAGAPVR